MSATDPGYPSVALASEQAFDVAAHQPDPGTTFGD